MTKLLILLSLTLFSTSSLAESVARFQYNFTLTSMMTGESIAQVDCEVRQVLQWGNAVNVFKCENTLDKKVFLMKGINGVIGYSYQKNVAYTKYYVSGLNGLISTTLKEIGSDIKVASGAMAEFYFYESMPDVNSSELLIDVEGDDALLLKIRNLYYLD